MTRASGAMPRRSQTISASPPAASVNRSANVIHAPLPVASVHKVLDTELGRDWRGMFRSFDDVPAAAASIGQVHRAVWADGRPVAVKIQYPGMAEAVEIDLRNLGLLLPLVKRLAPGLDVRALAAELRERVAEELDYEIEAQNHRTMARAWRGHPFAHVPTVYTSLSSRRVLVTELLEEAQRSRRPMVGEHSAELVPEPLPGDGGHGGRQLADRRMGGRLDGEIEASGEARGADEPQGVLGESIVRDADSAEHPMAKVAAAAMRVDDAADA